MGLFRTDSVPSVCRLGQLLACCTLLLSLSSFHLGSAFARDSSLSHTADLSVVVSDPTGAVIPNAEVTFQGAEKLRAKTTQDGSVRVALPYGGYVVRVARPGFKTTKITNFQVRLNKPPVLNVVLELGRDCDDCCDDCFAGIQTTTSDLPHVIEGRPGADLNPPTGSGFTSFPPSVYMQFFGACFAAKPCVRSETFRVDSVPKGCCILEVTNGDGRGGNEVKSYDLFLNGKRVLPAGSRSARVEVPIRQRNTIKAVLVGEPSSKIFILFAYDPRQPK